MAKRTLNDRMVKALRPAEPGKRYDLMDSIVPGFGVRVTDKGRRTYILVARFPGSTNPTRRALDDCGAITLEKARDKARDWLALIAKGDDPATLAERQRHVAAERRANTFEAVAADFIRDKLASERRGKDAERDIRREFIPAWGKRPVAEIADTDILAMIREKKRYAPVQARNLLALAKRLFQWAVDQRVYGLKVNPAGELRPAKLIGERAIRSTTLSDDELFALWRAAGRVGYPCGPVYRMLALTALRLNEVADASWSEFNEREALWIIPAARMKGRDHQARPHAVPLTEDIVDVLEALPRFKGEHTGDHLFTTTRGVKPAWIGDKVKKRLDARMLRTLKALERARGGDPAKVELKHWTNHDIRRTVRTNLSKLRIPEEAREALLAHVRPGVKGNYDHHDYLDEKREALVEWQARLRSIVTGERGGNVVPFMRAAS